MSAADEFEVNAEKFGEMAALFRAIRHAADVDIGKAGNAARLVQVPKGTVHNAVLALQNAGRIVTSYAGTRLRLAP